MVMMSLNSEPFTFLVRIIVRAFQLFERILTLNKDEIEFLTTFPLSEDQNIRYISFFSHQGWVPLRGEVGALSELT